MRSTVLVSAIVAGLIPSAITAPAEAMSTSIISKLGADLTEGNHYGSPNPPWHPGSKPGWYYGSQPEKHHDLPCLTPDNCKWLSQYPQAIHCPHSYPPPPPPHYPPHHSPPPPPPHYPPPHTTKEHHTTDHHTTKYTTKPTPTGPTYTTPSPTYTPLPPPPPPYYPTFYNITAAVQADDYMTYGLVDTVDDCKAMCDSVEGCGFVNTYHDVHGKDGSPLLTCALFKLCHGAEDADNKGGQSQPDGSIDYIADSDGWCKQSQ